MSRLKPLNAIYAFLIATLLITSCKKNPSNSPSPSKPTTVDTTEPTLPKNVDVYFAGTVTGAYPNNSPVATYWKNDTAKTLTNPDNASYSTGNAILVNNKDIYIAGSTSFGSGQKAVLWKNGVGTSLSSAASSASALVFNNTDLYVAGFTTDNNGSQEATYWKNGVANVYAPASNTIASGANAIGVYGSDVYMVGYTFDFGLGRGYNNAAYWKNGVLTTLTTNNNSTDVSLAYAMASNGTDIFIVGIDKGKATLWKNGVATYLENNASSQANAIILNGADVYVAGFVNEQPTFWKNGVETILPDAQPNSNRNIAIAINGSDVFIASGIDKNGNSIFWINGKTAQLNPLAAGLSSVYGMTAMPH